jgi:hypothetical protein
MNSGGGEAVVKRVVVSAAVVLCAVVAGAAPASAGTWRVQAVPEPASAELVGVSCPARLDCTAVAASGQAEQWNGSSWSVQALPDGARTAVSCAAPDSCIAVGDVATDHWDGASWTSQPVPLPPGAKSFELDAVSCAAPASCIATGFWAVDTSGLVRPLAEQWDGTSWTVLTVPMQPGAASEDLGGGLSCPVANHCLAVGDFLLPGQSSSHPLAARWNGTRWTIQDMPNAASGAGSLRGVSCAATTSCTAVGISVNSITGATAPLVERMNGTSWTIQPDAAPASAILTAVSCPTLSWCTAVGEDASDTGVAEYWDGTSWTAQALPVPHGHARGASLLGVSCLSAFHCTAAGTYGRSGHPLAEHEN